MVKHDPQIHLQQNSHGYNSLTIVVTIVKLLLRNNMLKLELPALAYKESFLEALEEFREERSGHEIEQELLAFIMGRQIFLIL